MASALGKLTMRISRWSALVLAALLVASCDEDDALGPSSAVESVAVIPGIFSLVVGDTMRLTTIARGEVGNPLAGRSVSWESSAPTVATIAQTGLVTATGTGTARITATVDGQSGTAALTVSPRFDNATFTSVVAGGAHSCAVTATGEAYCWGRGENGQLGSAPPVTTCLGDQTYPCALVPLPVDGGKVFVQLSGGGAYTCGLTSDGTAWCWGNNAYGQLGDSSLTTRNAPVAVATSVRFASIHAGEAHTCGLTSAGAAWCWGLNSTGQLGDGTFNVRLVPVAVSVPAGVTFQSIVPGGTRRSFTCALATTGTPYCWGSNYRGQLGRGTQDFLQHPLPEAVPGSLTFTTLTAGFGDQVCGLTAAGAAHCWGGNSYGEIGDGSSLDSFQPLAVAGNLTFTRLVAGGYEGSGHTCGLTSTGAAYCWGENRLGSVGDGSSSQRRATPVAVAGGLTFASLDAGYRHTCGRTKAGVLYCWGSGRTGQLGANSASSSFAPVKVAGQQ